VADGTPDWPHEWIASARWVGEAYAATLVGFIVVVWLLARYTSWGRQFRRISVAYFWPGRGGSRGGEVSGWRPVLRLLLLLLLTVMAVRIQVLTSYSLNGLYTALQALDASGFARYLRIFGVLAALYVARALLSYYLQQAFSIHWRLWLNECVLSDWLEGRAYHRGNFLKVPVDNPDQRIQEDVTSFAERSIDFVLKVVNAALSLVSFTVILWALSGPMTVFGEQIPRAMTFLTYLYAIVASVIAFRIGRPLIRLNFLNEGLAASFRYGLVRLRDNSENVAFHRGEPAEKSTLTVRFGALIENNWALVYRNVKFQGWNAVISQLAVVFPLVIQAPRFFSGALKLGDLTQTATAFGQVHDSLSYFRNAYDEFADYRAVLDRLTGLLDADDEARALPVPAQEVGDGLDIARLTVNRPDGRPLVEDLRIELRSGDALLVSGASGSGKTTLLRSLAGLWPYAEGSVRRPADRDAMFLSQQPYLPLGSLRAALAYPEPSDVVTDELATAVLTQVQLRHLAGRLDEATGWSRTLSPGEQQRLGFGRILIREPRIAFLDEATSALDEGIEHELYTLIRTRLPECIVVSVGHRTTLAPLHTSRLEILGDGRWALSVRTA
jgi:putative ATP-binding cassette transporter